MKNKHHSETTVCINRMNTVVLWATLCCLNVGVHAKITPVPLFVNNAIFQQGVPLPIWGTATSDEKEIAVTYRGQSLTSDICEGQWRVELDPLAASADAAMMTIQGKKEKIAIKNTLVGEVWLASGQSNMEFGMNMFAKSNPNITENIKEAEDSLFRMIKIRKESYLGEMKQNNIDWKLCSPTTAGGFSATAFYFARDLRKKTGVPVGIILCAWSGSAIETWIPQDKLSIDSDLKPIVDQYKAEVAKLTPEAYEKLVDAAIDQQKRFDEKKKKTGIDRKKLGLRPRIPMGPKSPTRPGSHYDVMLKPLVPYAIKGVIWYQGETNGNQMDFETGGPFLYRKLFPSLISTWRTDWDKVSLPFIFVQLPSWKGKPLKGDETYQGWAELRDSQLQAFKETKHTGMAVTLDIGDFDDIHPNRKEEVGRRLALCAQQIAYGDADKFSAGPVSKSYSVKGGRIYVSFEYTNGGLVLNSANEGFLICGSDQKFYPAQAKATGTIVEVWSDEVLEPIAVRYGWKNYFKPSLFDTNGLPASPFRTDEFKLTSQP